MDPQLIAAVSSSKLIKLIIKLFGGGGTAAPGLLAEYIDPKILNKLAKYYKGAIFVTGTNGKTTTARLLGKILEEAKIGFIHNRSGSNLLRGLIGTMIDNLTFDPFSQKTALFEVDEATLPLASITTNPKVIIFNNLFRDQLDRYGEVDKIRKIWQKTLLHLDSSTTLILNSDDHSVAHLGSISKTRVIYFGIEDKNLSLGKLPHASDFTSCLVCDGELQFDEIYLSHLGKYRCSTCGLVRPKPDVYANKIILNEEKGFSAQIITPKGEIQVNISLPGLYNVYNTLAAVSAGLSLGINLNTIKKALEASQAAFGRAEILDFENKKIFIGLVKNPTGFNEVLRVLFNKSSKKFLMIAVNDLIADGRDVSWFWDVDFEVLVGKTHKIWLSGIRASDMNLRLKYTGAIFKLETEENIQNCFEKAIEGTQIGETLYILPTYTALLEIKKIMARKGISSEFWED